MLILCDFELILYLHQYTLEARCAVRRTGEYACLPRCWVHLRMGMVRNLFSTRTSYLTTNRLVRFLI